MVVPGRWKLLSYTLKPHRPLKHHSLTQIPHLPPKELLIRCMRLHNPVPALLNQLLSPHLQLLATGEEDIYAAFQEIYPQLVAVADEGEICAGVGGGEGCCFGCDIKD